MELRLVFRKMAACFRLGSKRAAALRPFLALFLAVALAVVLQNLVFAAHTETTAISPATATFVKNSTLRAFDFNVSWTSGVDNITAINISLPSGFLLGSFGNLSGAGFACTNVSASLINCSNSSANGLNPVAPSVIIQINATPQVATGTYNWVINTTDTAGAINGSVATTSVDSEAPTVVAPSVNVSSPTKLNTNFFINTSYNDGSGSGISACSYNVTNSTGGLVVSASAASSGGTTGVANATVSAALPDGANSIFFNCTDAVGFTGYSAATVLTVDTVVPTCSALVSNDSFAKNGDSVNFTATCTDVGAGISSVYLNLSSVNASAIVQAVSSGGGNYSAVIIIINPGADELKTVSILNVTDSAGNTNSSLAPTATLVVDSINPVVVAGPTKYPGVQTWAKNGNAITLNATVTDAPAGVASVTVNGSAIGAGESIPIVFDGVSYVNASVLVGGVSTAVYNLTVTATDNASNVNSTVTLAVNVDNSAPAVSAPTANVSSPTKLNTNFFINTSYTDVGSGVSACSYNVTNSSGFVVAWTPMAVGGSVANATITATLPDGSNSIFVNCSDGVGLVGYSSASVLTVDTVVPTCSALSSNASFARNGEVVNFSAACSDVGQGVSGVFFNLSALNSSVGLVQANPGGGNSYYYAVAVGASDGPKAVSIFNVSDAAGNLNASLVPTASVVVDNTNPSVSSPAVNVSAAKTGAPIKVSAIITDTNLNASRLFVFNSTGGSFAMAGQGGDVYAAFITVTEIGDNPSLRYNISAYDNASNLNGSMYVAFVLDNTAPVVAESSPANNSWTNDNTTSFQFTVTDNLASYTNCTLFVDSAAKGSNSSVANNTPTTIVSTELAAGARSWQVNCSDVAGNLNQSGARVLNVDVSNPNPFITSHPALSWTQGNTPTINFTITDDLDSALNYTVFVDGANVSSGTVANNTPQTYTLPIQAQGPHVVKVEALDEAGNRANSSAATIVVDYTNPSVANPAANVSAARTGNSINVSATITDANLNVSRLFAFNSTGGSFAMVPSGGNVFTAFITVTEIGDNPSLRYNISAYDNASNLNDSMYVTFNLDNTAPTVYAPTFNASSPTRLNTNIFINTSYSDGSGGGISACTYNVTNSSGMVVSWTSMASSGGTSGVANATISATLPDGPNSIFVNCSDAVGWVGYSSASTLIVDTVAPSWNQTPSSQTVEYGTAFYYQINASDLYLSKYSISDTANFTINPSTGAIQNNTFLPIGAHPLAAYVNDTAGNLNSSSFTVTVSDTAYPVVSNVTAMPSTGTAGVSISINATISDVPPLVVKARIQYVNKSNYAVVDYALLNMSASGSTYNATWATSGAYNGTYLVDINVTDGGGNNVIVNDGASIALGFDAQSAYSNSSVSTDSLNQTTISSANITIQIQANNSRQNESVTIVKYSGDPSGSSLRNNFGATEIAAFTDIVSSISGSNLTWALIKIYYTEPSWDENKLGVYYWNGTRWQKLTTKMSWVYGVGVNTTANYVWANVSHLSLFAAAGDEAGPQASQILLSANPAASNVSFTAFIDDTPSGGSDISAAEYYLNSTSPPSPGTATPLYPQDGLGFDGNKTEVVNGSINIDALTDGAHTIYVRGKDAASNWGTAAYSTFTVNKTAPTMGSISISSNAVYATSVSVTLSLSASNAYECAFSNDNSAYGAWESYAVTKPWLLSSGDGTKTVYYKCRNSAGLEASAISDSIVLDTAAPSINVTAPAAGTTVNGNYSVNFSISDANGVSPQNVSISIDGADWIATNSNFSYWWNTTVLQDGPHNIQVRATDSAGNTGDSLVRLAYVNNADRDAPALSAIANGSVSDSSAVIVWNTSEPADAQVEFGVVSGSYVQGGLYAHNSTNHSVLLSGLQKSMLYFYRVKSRDASGNLNVSSEYNFTTSSVDTTAPFVNITYPAAGSAVNGVVSVNYTISDSGGVNGSNVSIMFDGADWIVANSNFSYSWNTSLFADYSHTIKIRAIDSSGNAGYSEILSVYVNNLDRIAPGIFNVSASANLTTALIVWNTSEPADVQVAFGTVSGSYILTDVYSQNSTNHSVVLSPLSPGTTYFYRVKSRDASGNWNTSGEFNFTTLVGDVVAPGILNVSVVVNVSSAVVSWNTTENADALVEYGLSSGSYSWVTGTYADNSTNHTHLISGLSSGTLYFYRVKSKDASGNQNTSQEFNFTTLVGDVVAPAISSVANGTVTDSYAIITWSTDENASSQVEYGLSVSYGLVTGELDLSPRVLSHSVNLTTGLSPGTLYHYRVLSRDASGNLNISADYTFTTSSVDTTAAVVNVTYPAASSTVNGVVLVNYSISDSGGVNGSNVSIQFDGGGGWIQANSNFSYSWNTSLFLDGAHFLQVKAVDSSGNAGLSDLRLVYVNNADRIAPGIFAVLSVATSSSATISWNTTENADSLVEYGLSSGSYSWVTGTYADNSTTHSVLVSGLSSGTQYFYRLKSRDNSGNLNASQEFSFTTQSVDSSLPSVAIVSPRGGEYVGLSKAVSINVSDGSGIDPATILLYKDGALLHQYSLPECTGAGTTASPYLCSWLWNTTEDDDGVPHTLLLSAYDLASNRQTHSITVFVDRVKPLIQSNTAPSNSQYLYVSEPMVNFTVSRGSQGLVNKSSISVAVDGQASLDFNPASNCSLSEGTSDYFCSFRIKRYSYTQLGYAFNSSLMLGNHSLLISASDRAGNNATPRSVNFTLLDVNDTVSINSIVMDKATAVANGLDYWQYTFSVSLGSSAGNRISLKLADWQDGYGHSIPASYANLTVGSNKVAIGNSYLYTLPVSDVDSSTAGVQASLIVKQYIPSGTEPVSYYTTYGIKTFDLDNPALSSTLPANNSFLNYAISNVTAIFSDSGGSGIDLTGSGISLSNTSGLVSGTRVSLQPDSLALNLSGLPDGNYTIGALPRDKYGNAGSTYYAYFVLDRIPPTAAALNPLPTYTTNLRVYLNWSGASDDRSGVYYYQIWRSSGSGFANIANTTGTSYNDTAVSDGVLYYYNISTVDRAGNVQFYSALSSTTIDITQPSAPILSPLATPTGTPAVTVSGTAEPNSTVNVYLNGAFAGAKVASAGGAFTTDSFALSEGNNILNATATDLAGLVSAGSAPLSVLLDTTPPVIGSLSPANSSNVSSAAPEISAVFNESGSGINASTILLIVDSAAASYSYDPAARKVSNVSALSEGVHNISLFVRDLVGNPSLLLQWSFRVDLTPPPQISGLSVVQDTNTTLNLSWSASPAPDLAYYKIYRRELVSFSNVSLAALVNGSLTSTSYRDSGLAPSWTYYYAVTAVDNVGNENSTVVSKYNATLS